MTMGSDDSSIHAEAIVKAACINAAASLIAAGKISIPSSGAVTGTAQAAMETAVTVTAHAAIEMWNLLEKPDRWLRSL